MESAASRSFPAGMLLKEEGGESNDICQLRNPFTILEVKITIHRIEGLPGPVLDNLAEETEHVWQELRNEYETED